LSRDPNILEIHEHFSLNSFK
jgi:carboxymethylenebutenolidase